MWCLAATAAAPSVLWLAVTSLVHTNSRSPYPAMNSSPLNLGQPGLTAFK
jgi:hypothetical protein